jgi:hypothetical protein
MDQDIFTTALQKKARYHRFFRYWNLTHLTFGVASVIASTTVAALPPEMWEWEKTVLAALAAVLTAVLTFFKPTERASMFLTATDIVERAINRRRADDPAMTNIRIVEEIEKADNIFKKGGAQ